MPQIRGVSQLCRIVTSVAHEAPLFPQVISEHLAPSVKKKENTEKMRTKE